MKNAVKRIVGSSLIAGALVVGAPTAVALADDPHIPSGSTNNSYNTTVNNTTVNNTAVNTNTTNTTSTVRNYTYTQNIRKSWSWSDSSRNVLSRNNVLVGNSVSFSLITFNVTVSK